MSAIPKLGCQVIYCRAKIHYHLQLLKLGGWRCIEIKVKQVLPNPVCCKIYLERLKKATFLPIIGIQCSRNAHFGFDPWYLSWQKITKYVNNPLTWMPRCILFCTWKLPLKFLRLFKLGDVPGKSQTSGISELKRPLQEFRVSGLSPVRREEKRFQGKKAIFSFLGSDIAGGIRR